MYIYIVTNFCDEFKFNVSTALPPILPSLQHVLVSPMQQVQLALLFLSINPSCRENTRRVMSGLKSLCSWIHQICFITLAKLWMVWPSKERSKRKWWLNSPFTNVFPCKTFFTQSIIKSDNFSLSFLKGHIHEFVHFIL